MSYGKKLARAFALRLVAFNATIATSKDTSGMKCPGAKPGNYHASDTIPENSRKYGNGQCKGGPSKTMERLRDLAKSKGNVWKFGI